MTSFSGSTAAMRDTECLVKIEVRDIGTEFSGLRQSNLRIQIGSVEIDLAAVTMNEVAQRADIFLKNSVRRRIGDHDRGQML